MGIIQATRKFETWLGKTIELVPKDLEYKHRQMRADPFLFFGQLIIDGAGIGSKNVRSGSRRGNVDGGRSSSGKFWDMAR